MSSNATNFGPEHGADVVRGRKGTMQAGPDFTVLPWKGPVRVATITAGTLASDFEDGDTVDGVVLVEGDRVLIKDQAAPEENGVYVVNASGAPDRSDDMDTGDEFVGAIVFVLEGTNAGTAWACTNTTDPDVDTDAVAFAQIGASALVVEEDGSPVVSPATVLDAGHGLDVTDEGGGVAGLAVDETELDGSLIPGVTAETGAPGEGAYTVETQNQQSRRWLMQNGEFRDPLIVGDGTITPGSVVTISDYTGDPDYLSWPAAGRGRLRNGQILVAYHRGNGHDTDNSGKVVGKIGDEALDGTIAWGSEFTIYDHASLNVTPGGIVVLSTGRVLVTLDRFDNGVSGSGEAGVVYSDDQGVTWSAWIDLTNTFAQEAYAAGTPVELPDGSVLAPIEGTDAGAVAHRSSRTVLSTDGGLTWGSETVVHAYATDSTPCYESCLVLVNREGLDELQIYHRTSDPAGNITRQISSNLGATAGGWAVMATAFPGYARPAVAERWTSTLVCPIRDNADASVRLFTSLDHGDTWDAGTTVASGMFEMEYATTLDLLTGEMIVIFGTQPTSSTSNADLKLVPVSEGLLDVRDALSITAADVSIADVGGYFTGTDVEAALQELGADLAGVSGYREVLMVSGISDPPDPLISTDGTDWLYGVGT